MDTYSYENADQFMKVVPLVENHFRNRSDDVKHIADNSIRAMITEDMICSNLKPIESYLTLELISSLDELIATGKIESVDNTTLSSLRFSTTLNLENISEIKSDKDAKEISETLNTAFAEILKVKLRGKKKLQVNNIYVKAGYTQTVQGNKLVQSVSFPQVAIEVRGEIVKTSK